MQKFTVEESPNHNLLIRCYGCVVSSLVEHFLELYMASFCVHKSIIHIIILPLILIQKAIPQMDEFCSSLIISFTFPHCFGEIYE